MKIIRDYWDEELETTPYDRLREMHNIKMQKHLLYAYHNSLFYKKRFDRLGIKPEEIRNVEEFRQKIPFLTHEQVLESQKGHPPFGDILTVGIKDIKRIYCSSGPFNMPISKDDMDLIVNVAASGLYNCGARRGDIVDVTSSYQWNANGTILDDAFRLIGCAVIPGGSGVTRTHASVIKQLGVTVMFAFPSFAVKLAGKAKEMGIDPLNDLNIRLIIVGGEICDENDKKTLAEEFGAEVREIYGGVKIGFVGAECAYGGGMHCLPDSILEVVDLETGMTVSDGRPGEIVITDLSRKSLPFIRYRTGDLTEGINEVPCACGRTSPRLGRIVGRD